MEDEIFKYPIGYLVIMEIAESGDSLDAGKRGGADAAISLAAQVTFIVTNPYYNSSTGLPAGAFGLFFFIRAVLFRKFQFK